MRSFLTYFLLRVLLFPFELLPTATIHKVGKALGLLAYFTLTKFRKRALSNLSLASALKLSEKQVKEITKQSFQSLMITCLEYPKLSRLKEIHSLVRCENPQAASELLESGKGVIFFCAHQANWELLFIEGTSRMPGVAIGRPIKNHYLYKWILSIREKFGGKIITPKNAAKEGLRALRRGAFLGIVGDQGMPDSGFSCPFLGRNAWTSPLPALLACRTGAALILATIVRTKNHYRIHYGDPLFADPSANVEAETERLMKNVLSSLEESIKKHPGQWLWQHNRWKQQGLDKLKRRFRQDALAIFMPNEKELFSALAAHLSTFRKLYPLEWIILYVPEEFSDDCDIERAEKHLYKKSSSLFMSDLRIKLLFNFTGERKLKRHFLRQSAFEVVDLIDLQKMAKSHSTNLSELLPKAICRA